MEEGPADVGSIRGRRPWFHKPREGRRVRRGDILAECFEILERIADALDGIEKRNGGQAWMTDVDDKFRQAAEEAREFVRKRQKD